MLDEPVTGIDMAQIKTKFKTNLLAGART